MNILLFIFFKSFFLYTGKNELTPSEPLRFYISNRGNDENNGTYDAPFASFEAAKQAVRKILKTGTDSPVEIIVRKGTYYFNETLEFTGDDSGTSSSPVTWKAAEGENVILSGGKRLFGKWQKTDNDLWYLDLPEAKGWQNDVNQPEKYIKKPLGPLHFRELYVNGTRAIRARYPNVNIEKPFLFAIANSSGQIKVKDGILKKSWGEEKDAQINLVPRWRFFNQWNDVVGVDMAKNILQLGPRELHGEINKGSWFWIEGVKEELDTAGEWFLDHDLGRLYFKPFDGKNPEKSEIIVPYLNRLIYLKGSLSGDSQVKNLHFKGFRFKHTSYTLGHIEARVHTDCAFMLENASECSVVNCYFENIGGYAVWLHLDSKNNQFDGNFIQHTGGGGFLMTGARLSYMDESKIFTSGENASKVFPILNRITRNQVEQCGKVRYYGGGVHIDSRPASMAMEPGNYIAHNHFKDLSRNGIFIFRNQGGNIIEFNEIHDCMQTTIDGAAIHLATMNRLAAPNYIMDNYLYDIWGFEQLPEGNPRRTLANGIFLDWATSYTTVSNNVIYNTGEREIKAIMGNWNLVFQNNLASKTRILPLLPKECGPAGTASHIIYPESLKHTGKVITTSDHQFLKYEGVWVNKRIEGLRNLFKYDCRQAGPEQEASCTYQLNITETGDYKVCMMYFPDASAATNATLTIIHAKGTEKIKWNFRKGDPLGFAVNLGVFPFEKGKQGYFILSNENADGFIIADGIGLIKQ